MKSNTENKTKILSAKTVFQSKYFRVQQVEIQRSGKTFTKDIIEKTPFVSIIPFTENYEIYLESQYRDAFGKVVLEVPAGKIPSGEDLLSGAKRELLEETGLTAKIWKHAATWEISPNMRQSMHVFFATGLGMGLQKLDEDEDIEIVKISLKDAIEKIKKGEIVFGHDIAAILLFDKLKQEGQV